MALPAYRPEIDGLRALAIAAVVLFHAYPELLPGGFIGVDIFFVISGYLISRIILGGLADGSFSFADFYARRIRRIVPALIVVMLATCALGALVLSPEGREKLSLHAMAGASFTSNLLLWREAGYFDTAAESKPFLHLWSLGVEEQFYLIWPLLLYLAVRWRLSVLAIAAIVGGASFLMNVHGIVADPDGAFYSPATRFWELMIGCGLAARESRMEPADFDRRQANIAAVAGLGLMVAGLALIDRDRAFPGAWALLPTLGAALFIGGGNGSWLNAKVFARAPMVQLGLMSYALYLWHWPMLAFLNDRHPEGAPPLARLAAVLLAVLLAWVTYAGIERRIRSIPARRTVPLLAGSCALVVLGALAAYQAEPGADAAVEGRLRAAQAWPTAYSEDRRCKERHPTAGYCAIADPHAAPTHALIGDSHANHFFPGLAAEVARGGGNLIHLGAAGCIPFFGMETSSRANCATAIDNVLADVIAEKSIRTVILAANWHVYARGTRFSAYRNRQASTLGLRSGRYGTFAGNEALFTAGLSRTVDMLEQAGKNVIFLKQIPELETRFEKCLEQLRSAANWSDGICAVARQRVNRYLGEYASLVDAALAGRAQVSVLDPAEVLCDRNFCRAVSDSVLMYRDDVHLSIAGSKHVIGRLWPRGDATPTRRSPYRQALGR